MRITFYVHAGVENSSERRLTLARELEQGLIAELREEAPDPEIDAWTRLALRPLAQRLREKDIENPLPERLVRLLRSLSADGRDEPGATRSIEIRARDLETIGVRLRRTWDGIERIARLRRDGAALLLIHLLGKAPKGVRGVDLLVETTYGALTRAIDSDLALKSQLKGQLTQPLVDRALLWMHEQEVVTLNRGLTVFRPAMKLKVKRDGSSFTLADFRPLKEHYSQKTAQIHFVAEYARLGMEDIRLALRLAMDYFKLDNETFVRRWFKGKEKTLGRETLSEHYERIVANLGNRAQQGIVADDRERTNVLVLAGPGSGKTRVLVHRIAYLIRVRREHPSRILALTYNRHAAVQVRRRLRDLIGKDGNGVYVLTCHALALRILGISFAETSADPDDQTFRSILEDAARLLGSEESSAGVTREQLIGRLTWILVDEYQDIGKPEYELISALAGRTLAEEDARLNLFAVGDDDQNIYAFKGASVHFIRRFAEHYRARAAYLVENYRSSGNIIDAANRCIEAAEERLKRGHDLKVDSARKADPPGGRWRHLDGVVRGKVQILRLKGGQTSQAVAAVEELKRLSELDRKKWRWDRCAIVARHWSDLEPAQSACALHGIPAQSAREEAASFWRARETQALLVALKNKGTATVSKCWLERHQSECPEGPWGELLAQALEELLLEESGASRLPVTYVQNWLGEWGRDVRRKQQGLLLTSAHRAKGLEFDHVAILDGRWQAAHRGEDRQAPRRLYYVAMTRARETLTLLDVDDAKDAHPLEEPIRATLLDRAGNLLRPLAGAASVIEREAPAPDISDYRLQERVMVCGMQDVVLSFAGWRSPQHPTHRAIARLKPGDPLSLVHANGYCELFDSKNRDHVGRMAKRWNLPKNETIVRASVHGIFVRQATDGVDETFRQRLQAHTWEIVVPEFVSRRRSAGPVGL